LPIHRPLPLTVTVGIALGARKNRGALDVADEVASNEAIGALPGVALVWQGAMTPAFR
jgi:hypothetical protein